ncbi:MAG: hypothetical protein KAI66_17625, partial [Lentisphaeria bacterium]|nr:hypothetical protein [Lentisphaeria bacterium]
MRFLTLTGILLCTLSAGVVARAADDEPTLEGLSAAEFLTQVRRPFRQDAWGEITGQVTHSSSKGRHKGKLRIRLTFSAESLHAQIVLNEKNVYGYEQVHGTLGAKAKITLDLPEEEIKPGLFEFGLEPEDISFAFVYWDLLREFPRESYRHRDCRVMELRHPEGKKGTVRVWFEASRGFPLKAQWYRPDEQKHWRLLELKGAKRHAKKLWFVKEMRIEGDGWKTKVRFDHVEINPVEDAVPTAPE